MKEYHLVEHEVDEDLAEHLFNVKKLKNGKVKGFLMWTTVESEGL